MSIKTPVPYSHIVSIRVRNGSRRSYEAADFIENGGLKSRKHSVANISGRDLDEYLKNLDTLTDRSDAEIESELESRGMVGGRRKG